MFLFNSVVTHIINYAIYFIVMSGFIAPSLAIASITTVPIDGTKSFTTLSSPLGGVSGCGIAQGSHTFTTVPLVPINSGQHTLETISASGNTSDTFLAIYSPTFDPNNPTDNLIACNDDGGVGLLSKLTTNLDVETQFVLVVTTFRTGTLTGTTTVNITPDVVLKTPQILTLTIPEVDTFAVGDTFSVSANSDSGLAVDIFTENEDVCTLEDNQVLAISTGVCVLTALQAGNENFAQSSVSRTLIINKGNQTIAFNDPVDQTFINGGSGTFEVLASSDSGLAVTVVSTSPAICTVSGNTITMVSVGNCELTASQAGNESFNPAVSVGQRVVIGKANQTITFNDPANQIFVKGGVGTFEAPVSSDSGLLVTVESTRPAVCTVSGNTITMISVGNCELTASQVGNENFNSAADVSQSVSIAKANQAITFTAIETQTFVNDATFSVFATSDSELDVSIVSDTPTICSLDDNTVSILDVGNCLLTASQAGNDNFNDASTTQTIVIQPSESTPVITEGERISVSMGTDGQVPVFNLTLNATDGDENSLIWRINANGSQGVASVDSDAGNSKVISYVLNDVVTANRDSFIVEVSDGALTDFIIVTVFIIDSSVNSVNDTDSNNNGITDRVETIFGTTDSDADGIPDDLETLLGRNVTAITDTDGDGMPDVSEVLIGRDPNSNDNTVTESPVITVATSPLNFAAKGTVSAYSLAELGVSALDGDVQVTPEAYFKNGVCMDGVPYNYEIVCNKVPNSGYNSGVTAVWWLLTDAQGNWGRNQQVLNILPQVNIEFTSQVLSADKNNSLVTIKLLLSGDTVFGNAFSIPFIISGSAQSPADHNLVVNQFQFQGNALSSDPITVGFGNAPRDGKELVVTLDTSSNVFNQPNIPIDTRTQFVTAGNQLSQLITITQQRFFAPRLSNLKGIQNTNKGRLFDKNQGNITLSFDMIDPDGGNYTFSWRNSSNALRLVSGALLSSSTIASPVLDISQLPIGRYFIEGRVTDSSSNSTSIISAIITIEGGLTLSANTDTDGDGLVDSVEGLGDDDGDGIANYLDAQNDQANVVPSDGSSYSNFLVRTEPNLRVLFGKTATAANKGGVNITLDDLAAKGDNGQSTTNSVLPNMTLSRIFDYEIEGIALPVDPNAQGNSITVVLPLVEALRADTEFFKYDANGWRRFTEDANNHIAWADFANGIQGNCPKISSTDYIQDSSQRSGKHCLKLTIQDGGANDADGVVNGRIVDPLGVAHPNAIVPVATIGNNADNASNGGGGSFNLLFLLFLLVWALKTHLILIRNIDES